MLLNLKFGIGGTAQILAILRLGEELKEILAQLVNADEYGVVLRAKGIVKSVNDGEWLHFNYVPGESSVTTGAADYTGRFCVIGSKLQEHSLQELFLGE